MARRSAPCKPRYVRIILRHVRILVALRRAADPTCLLHARTPTAQLLPILFTRAPPTIMCMLPALSRTQPPTTFTTPRHNSSSSNVLPTSSSHKTYARSHHMKRVGCRRSRKQAHPPKRRGGNGNDEQMVNNGEE